MTAPLLQCHNLRIAFGAEGRSVDVVHSVTFDVARGERLGVVGESGSGKSVTALAILSLLGRHGRVREGSILFDGHELTLLNENGMREVRGRRIAMIFQDPMTALNPAIAIGTQLVDVIRSHEAIPLRRAQERALDLITQVGISDASRRYSSYPHQLSGGQRQRIMIALALACRPDLMIADEPTTALDVTVQAQIIALLDDLCVRFGLSLIFISHNLDLVAELCDRIIVMKSGEIIERGSAEAIFGAPQHPYTLKLLASIPRLPAVENSPERTS